MSSVKSDFPKLFPSPKQVKMLEGMSDLSTDVRLVTNSVAPLQRKAIRTVLCDVGIRVVANKKKYLVEVRVEDASNFDMSDVPETGKGDYYELRIDGSEITILAPNQSGTVLASYTLAALLKMFMAGQQLPNVFIRDWPSCANRGIFIDCAWGMDKMNLSDWHKAIDAMAALKLNVLGIGFYNCFGNARFEGKNKAGEFLMAPFPEDDKLRVEHTMNWYSAEQDFWNKENYLADMASTEDLVTNIISYAAEKAIRVIPYFSSFGNNTLFPRLYKDISAKDEAGKPLGVGYCTSCDATKQFLEKTYGSFIERYFPNGAEFFDIGLDEVFPEAAAHSTTKVLPWCQCAECRKKSQEQLVADYIVWLVKMLVSKNVQKVVIHNGLIARQLKVLDKAFAKRLEDEGIKDNLLLLWQETSNDGINAKNRASAGVKLGIESWVSPLQNKESWNIYTYNRHNVDTVIRQGFKDGANGVMAYSVFDPTHIDHQALLAAYCWESVAGEHEENIQRRWTYTRFGDDSKIFIDAIAKLKQIAENDVYALCPSFKYTCIDDSAEWPREYPGEALKALEALDNPDESLEEARQLATEADELFERILARENVPEDDKFVIGSLRSECARVQAYTGAFLYFLNLRREMADGMVMKRMVTSTMKARDDFMDCMVKVEQGKPYHCIPGVMHGMSLLFAFFSQFIYDLKKHAARKQAKLLLWGLTDEKK